MYDVTKLVAQKVFEKLLAVLPTPRQRKEGRPRVAKEALLCGILQVLVNGVAWNKMAPCGCSYGSCYRYFQKLQRTGKLKLIFETLARVKTNLLEGAIDTTTVSSFNFERGVGWDGHHHKTGTKISLFSDKFGLPADAIFGKGDKPDPDFLEEHWKHTAGKLRKLLNLDKLYVSLERRREFKKRGTKINMEMKANDYKRKRGPKFSFNKLKYQVRFLIERLNGWLKDFRSIRIRRTYHMAMFKAFVYLALIIVLVRYS